MKKALITGITGQDGSYLAELLLEKGYQVHGIVRRSSLSLNLRRIEHILNNNNLFLHMGDLSDSLNLVKLITAIKPDEIYNLAAQSQVYASFEIPEYTSQITALGTLRLLEAVRISQIGTKFFQASSSQIFGMTEEVPQNENTAFNPQNPYGISKLYSHYMTRNYRNSYGMFNCNAILYSHESPRRSENFVSKKITKAIAKILAKKQKEILLGNIDNKRDWGYAKDYVRAMWLMLQQDTADDYVISSGQSYSIRDFLKEAFSLVNLDYTKYVKTDEKFLRPLEKNTLFIGDSSKAFKKFGWKPETSFQELVKIMLEADLKEEGISL